MGKAIEITALGLGTAGLAMQFFQAGCAGYSAVQLAHHAGEEAEILLTELNIEQCIFRSWGRAIGLVDADVGVHAAQASGTAVASSVGKADEAGQDEYATLLGRSILETLCYIASLVNDVTTLRERYGLDYERHATTSSLPGSEGDLGDLEAGMGSSVRSIVSTPWTSSPPGPAVLGGLEKYKAAARSLQSSFSLLQKVRWALVDRDSFHRLVKELRRKNKSLKVLQNEAQNVFAAELCEWELLRTNDPVKLNRLQRAGTGSYSMLADGAAVKSLTLKAAGGSFTSSTLPTGSNDGGQGGWLDSVVAIQQQQLTFDRSDHRRRRRLATYHISKDATNDPLEQKSVRVLLEWKRSGAFTHLTVASDGEGAKVVLARVQHLVALLTSSRDASFRTLSCVGYHYAPASRRIAFVFELPSMAAPFRLPSSLSKLINGSVTTSGKPDYAAKPPLEARLQLASALASSLHYLHRSDWLHKGIAASNVLFFRRQAKVEAKTPREIDLVDMGNPYLTGFDFSRAEQATNLSENLQRGGDVEEDEEEIGEEEEVELYRHPALFGVSSSRTYSKADDAYALGLLLIQVAFWETMSYYRGKALSESSTSPSTPGTVSMAKTTEALRKFVLSSILDSGLLRYRMGTDYEQAVRHCLVGFDRGQEAQPDEAIREKPGAENSFYERVVVRLRMTPSHHNEEPREGRPIDKRWR